MESLKDLSKSYSYSNSNLPKVNNSNSTVEATAVIKNLSDIIPNDGYTGFYLNKFRELGSSRFMELAQKARAGSDTPAKLFAWMLKHNELVK